DTGGVARHRILLPRRPRDDQDARHGRSAPPRAAPFDTEASRSRVSSSGTVEGDARIRLFCALTLDDETLDRLVAWQASLPAGNARVVPRANLHLTLAFLGHRPAAELDGIGRELGEAAGGAGGM